MTDNWADELPPYTDADAPSGDDDLGVGRDHDHEFAEFDRQQKFNIAVSNQVAILRIAHEARARFDAELAARVGLPPFDAGTLEQMLQRLPEPPYRIQDLMPSEASTTVVGLRKTGKTTFLLNLAHALITGEDFLGRFAVRAIAGNVGVLNFEVSGHTYSRWAEVVGVPPNRLYIVNLRGRRNPLANDADRAMLAKKLKEHDVEALITDPFGRAYTGKSQNDPGDVGARLADLDRFARGDAGATDLVLSAHTGWEGERTRGSSALEDWPDSIMTLVRNVEGERYMHAFGRDVDIEEDRLDHDPRTRRLTLAGSGSRKVTAKVRQLDELIPIVIAVVEDDQGCNGSAVEKQLREDGVTFQKGDERKALKIAVERGLLDMQPGKGTAKNYFTTGTLPKLPQTLPAGESESSPSSPLTDGGALRGTTPTDLPQATP